MTETATKPAKKAAARPTVDRDAVHQEERKVGDKLEKARQDRIEVRDFKADRDPIWEHLARPFPDSWVEKLPKNLRKNDDRKARCEDTPAGRTVSADGHFCGGWHAKALHLDYIGHAGVTMRLNEDVGPENWSLEPLGVLDNGLPAHTGQAFWVKLTILGVSKIDLAESFSSTQEAWGDALRRAAMRFGIGTYLWSKSEYAFNQKVNSEAEAATPEPEVPVADHSQAVKGRLDSLTQEQKDELTQWWTKAGLPKWTALSPQQAAVVNGEIDRVEEVARQELLKARLGATEVPEGQS